MTHDSRFDTKHTKITKFEIENLEKRVVYTPVFALNLSNVPSNRLLQGDFSVQSVHIPRAGSDGVSTQAILRCL